MLNIENVTVKFGGLTAVKGMDMHIKRNSIHSLIGPNGAGKTTLFNVITRVIKAAEGNVSLEGKPLLGLRPDEIIFRGIARTFQNLQLFQFMSVYDNLYAGYVHNYTKGFFSVFLKGHRHFDAKEAKDRVLETAEMLHIKNRLASLPSQLPYGLLKRVEIARALVSDPGVILFDEPAAGLTSEDRSDIIGILRLLNERGKTIFLVEHDMSVVMDVSDTVTVMNFGEKIAEGPPAEVSSNPEVVKVYLGSHE